MPILTVCIRPPRDPIFMSVCGPSGEPPTDNGFIAVVVDDEKDFPSRSRVLAAKPRQPVKRATPKAGVKEALAAKVRARK